MRKTPAHIIKDLEVTIKAPPALSILYEDAFTAVNIPYNNPVSVIAGQLPNTTLNFNMDAVSKLSGPGFMSVTVASDGELTFQAA